MKKFTLFNLLIVLSIGVIAFLSSCRRDKTDPVITLYGPEEMYISLNSPYKEPGFKATDNEDGDITKQVLLIINGKTKGATAVVDTSRESWNTIEYKVADDKGNVERVKRLVVVMNDSHALKGEYIGKVVYPYPGTAPVSYFDSVQVSTTKNNLITFSNFAGVKGNKITAKVKWDNLFGDELVLASQTNTNGAFSFPANTSITTKNCRVENGRIYVFFTRTVGTEAKDGMFELTPKQ